MQNVVHNVLLKLCLAVLLSNVALRTEAIRSSEFTGEKNAANYLACPNGLIAENPAEGCNSGSFLAANSPRSLRMIQRGHMSSIGLLPTLQTSFFLSR